MRTLAIALLSAALLSPLCRAELPRVGEPLPPLAIEDRGELLLAEDRPVFQPWQTDSSPAQPRVVQYLAARFSTSRINEPFTDALEAARLDPAHHQVITILNLDEALWGTRSLVLKELEKNKRQHPHAILVVDADGEGRNQWQLESAGSAILLVDAENTVQFFKQGTLTDAEIEQVLAALREAMPSAAAEGEDAPAR